MNKSVQQYTTDPWIDLELPSSTTGSFVDRDMTTSVHVNENLLLEAQRESSRTGSKGSRSDNSSPKSPKSPLQTAEWISYWSSRIETEPPKEWKFAHPMSRVIDDDDEDDDKEKIIVEKKHVRFLFLSNCASFILGMGIMYLCLRRYLRVKTPYFYSFD